MIICAAGDIHGALDRLYEDVLAFEGSLGVRFEWVLHVGDFGVWPDPNRIDGATKRHDGAGDFPARWAERREAPRRTLFIKGNPLACDTWSMRPAVTAHGANWRTVIGVMPGGVPVSLGSSADPTPGAMRLRRRTRGRRDRRAGGIEAEAGGDELIEEGLEGGEAVVEAGEHEHADGADQRQLLLECEPSEWGVVGDDQEAPVGDRTGEHIAVGHRERRPAQAGDQDLIRCRHAARPAGGKRDAQLRFAGASLALVDHLALDGRDDENLAALLPRALHLSDSGQRDERAAVDYRGHWAGPGFSDPRASSSPSSQPGSYSQVGTRCAASTARKSR